MRDGHREPCTPNPNAPAETERSFESHFLNAQKVVQIFTGALCKRVAKDNEGDTIHQLNQI